MSLASEHGHQQSESDAIGAYSFDRFQIEDLHLVNGLLGSVNIAREALLKS